MKRRWASKSNLHWHDRYHQGELLPLAQWQIMGHDSKVHWRLTWEDERGSNYLVILLIITRRGANSCFSIWTQTAYTWIWICLTNYISHSDNHLANYCSIGIQLAGSSCTIHQLHFYRGAWLPQLVSLIWH